MMPERCHGQHRSSMNACDWQMRRKENVKQQAKLLLKEWMKRMSIDDIVLSRDTTSLTTIDSNPVNNRNMVHLQSLCIKLKINGCKNKSCEDMIRLLLERKRIQIIESLHYPGESANLPHSNSDISLDDNDIDSCCPPSPTNNNAHPLINDSRSTQLPQSSGARQQGGILENTMASSSPETRSMLQARCLLATAEEASNEDGPSATTSSQEKGIKMEEEHI